MKTCSWKECFDKHYAKGLCRAHYRRVTGESTKWWEKTKSNLGKYEKRRAYQRRWWKDNPRDYRLHGDKVYFGGLREKTIQRDGERCLECLITRREHVDQWGIDLHVNHIDHTKRNEMDNLETLCIRCHARKSHEVRALQIKL